MGTAGARGRLLDPAACGWAIFGVLSALGYLHSRLPAIVHGDCVRYRLFFGSERAVSFGMLVYSASTGMGLPRNGG